MTYRKRFLLALIAIGIAACDASSSADPAPAVPASTDSNPSIQPAEEGATSMIAELESKLKEGMPYAELRKVVMAEGWSPMPDSECKSNVGGEASICDELPELEVCSGDGHCAMNFQHGAGSAKLRVTTYGEQDDWNVTGSASRLAVTGWSFSGQQVKAAQTRGSVPNTANQQTMENDLPFPADACTLDGYGAFFESFARSETVRAKYTAPQVQIRDAQDPDKAPRLINKAQYNQFKIGLMDYRWVYLDTAKDENSYERLNVKQARTGDTLRVDYIKAEFDAEHNLVSTHGEPRAYIFEFKQGCWYLTQDLQ